MEKLTNSKESGASCLRVSTSVHHLLKDLHVHRLDVYLFSYSVCVCVFFFLLLILVFYFWAVIYYTFVHLYIGTFHV